MGASFDLALPHLPSDRHAFPHSAFAAVWTQRPEDADRAYAIYRDRRDRGAGSGDGRALLDAFGGRPFRVPAVEATAAYRAHWEPSPWPSDQRGELAHGLAQFDANALALVGAVVARKRPVLLSVASYGVRDPGSALDALKLAGRVTVEPAPAGRGRDAGDRLIAYAGPDRGLVAWELGRCTWLCELLVTLQFAYEATQSALRQYREDGVISRVEVLGAADCCEECRRIYPRAVPIGHDIELPVPGCVNPHGCTCAVAPVVG